MNDFGFLMLCNLLKLFATKGQEQDACGFHPHPGYEHPCSLHDTQLTVKTKNVFECIGKCYQNYLLTLWFARVMNLIYFHKELSLGECCSFL